MKSAFALTFVLFTISGLATRALGATYIDVGNHMLLPNTPNQRIDIYVTGDNDRIQGVEVYAQIGNDYEQLTGIPVFQYLPGLHSGFPGPNLSTLIAPGSFIEPPVSYGEFDVTTFPTVWIGETTIGTGGTVVAHGLLATLYIDTTGIFFGQWPLVLGNTQIGTTDWAGSVYPPPYGPSVPVPVITNGSITIVPEPGSVTLAAIGLAGFLCWARRRKAARC